VYIFETAYLTGAELCCKCFISGILGSPCKSPVCR